MKKNKLIVAILIAGACFASVEITKAFILPRMQMSLDKRTLHRSKGDPSNPLWVVEYLDFQCGSCRFASNQMKDYFAKYPGKIFLQIRFFPINGHPHGMRSAVYSECAAEQNKFWDFYELVFEKQPEWSELKNIDAAFHEYAAKARLNIQKLDACVEDPKTAKTVAAEKEKAKALGVNVTPTFFIKGTMIPGIKNAIEALDKEFKK